MPLLSGVYRQLRSTKEGSVVHSSIASIVPTLTQCSEGGTFEVTSPWHMTECTQPVIQATSNTTTPNFQAHFTVMKLHLLMEEVVASEGCHNEIGFQSLGVHAYGCNSFLDRIPILF